MITLKQKGTFDKTNKFLKGAQSFDPRVILDYYGRLGVSELSNATPKDTGLTAASWNYKVKITKKGYSIEWTNSNTTSTGIPLVILLHYGHGTRSGAYVKGIDFINPALKPILDSIAKKLTKEVTSL
jgi:hypothetical protein